MFTQNPYYCCVLTKVIFSGAECKPIRNCNLPYSRVLPSPSTHLSACWWHPSYLNLPANCPMSKTTVPYGCVEPRICCVCAIFWVCFIILSCNEAIKSYYMARGVSFLESASFRRPCANVRGICGVKLVGMECPAMGETQFRGWFWRSMVNCSPNRGDQKLLLVSMWFYKVNPSLPSAC